MQKIKFKQLLILTEMEVRLRRNNKFFVLLITLITPLILFIIIYSVFNCFFKNIKTDYFFFLLIGLIEWNFFSNSISYASSSLIRRSNMLKNYPLNPLYIITSSILTFFLDHLLENILLIILLSIKFSFKPIFLSIFIIDFVFLLFIISISIPISILNLFFYDTERLLSFFLTVMFFITPVFYPKEVLNNNINFIFKLNPLEKFLEIYRNILLNNNFDFKIFIILFISSLILLIISIFLLKYKKKKILDAL